MSSIYLVLILLEAEFPSAVPNEAIAVFGDAGNDIELFGMQRSKHGYELEPLVITGSIPSASGPPYRPAVRVAMPWANDALLIKDSTEVASCDVVFDKIIQAKRCT